MRKTNKQKGLSHQYISVLKVVSPVWPDLPLTSNVPNIQFKPLRLYAFNVETLKESEKLNWLNMTNKKIIPPLLILRVFVKKKTKTKKNDKNKIIICS